MGKWRSRSGSLCVENMESSAACQLSAWHLSPLSCHSLVQRLRHMPLILTASSDLWGQFDVVPTDVLSALVVAHELFFNFLVLPCIPTGTMEFQKAAVGRKLWNHVENLWEAIRLIALQFASNAVILKFIFPIKKLRHRRSKWLKNNIPIINAELGLHGMCCKRRHSHYQLHKPSCQSVRICILSASLLDFCFLLRLCDLSNSC